MLSREELVRIRLFMRSEERLGDGAGWGVGLLFAILFLASAEYPVFPLAVFALLYFLYGLLRFRCAQALAWLVKDEMKKKLSENQFAIGHRALFYVDDGSFEGGEEEPTEFHNPDLDLCWDNGRPLFNLNEWHDFIPPYQNEYGGEEAYDPSPPVVDLKRVLLHNVSLADLVLIGVKGEVSSRPKWFSGFREHG